MPIEQPKLVTIIGGSGFIGTQLVQDLARMGYRVRVGVRRPDLAGHLRPLGTVGQIQPMQVNVRNYESVMAGVAGSDVVINLVGILYEGGRQRFRAVHTMGAAHVAQAAARAGVKTLIHMSALGADAESDSTYLRSRALGEDEVRKHFPEAIIIRPSLVFGPDDSFFNRFGMLARYLPVLPAVGAKSRFQPVYVGDVAMAIAKAAGGAAKSGTIYELGGPDVVTMHQIMELVNEYAHRNRPIFDVPEGLAKFMAWFAQWLPHPLLTIDQVITLQNDNVVSEAAEGEKHTLKAFGVAPTPMDDVLPDYMWRFRKHGEFERVEA
ncbi:MAG: complex I NDUFA9 subunit family protein [Hyphomicrobiaceae bacterium]|nr:complex I NDUFA9 subunit family protein [Hyphomicrobiaceae bacterium]MCC0023919.1 complex I NDUFA9 subunit family protein [Hyphomicrobiaceae bacterium]